MSRPPRRVLLTGMSGTGKSTVVRALVARGIHAVDADDGLCEPTPDGRQRLREDAVEALLEAARDAPLVLAACEENQVRFQPRFDAIVLLSAPADVLVERLAARTTNPFGSRPGEVERILADLREIEPLLRRVAHREIDATAPLEAVVDAVLAVLRGSPA